MIGKILLFPFVLVKNIVVLVLRVIGLGFRTVFGVLRFLFKHTLGVVIAAVVGVLLRKKHTESKAEGEAGEPEEL